MKKTAQLCVLSFLLVSMADPSALAQDGEKLYMTKFCITCHGQEGISVAPNYPNLAKQNERYLINQVRDIIQKKRANKLTLLMTENPLLINISDEEVSSVAAHLTRIKEKL